MILIFQWIRSLFFHVSCFADHCKTRWRHKSLPLGVCLMRCIQDSWIEAGMVWFIGFSLAFFIGPCVCSIASLVCFIRLVVCFMDPPACEDNVSLLTPCHAAFVLSASQHGCADQCMSFAGFFPSRQEQLGTWTVNVLFVQLDCHRAFPGLAGLEQSNRTWLEYEKKEKEWKVRKSEQLACGLLSWSFALGSQWNSFSGKQSNEQKSWRRNHRHSDVH